MARVSAMENQSLTTPINDSADRYKFLSIRTYADTEWLADNRKRYRQVYDQFELSYIYAELSFINKMFDREDWSATIELKCYRSQQKTKPVCHLTLERDIPRTESTVFIREGWGNKKEGVFWKPGTYYWEALIDGQKVGSRFFYVQTTGQKSMMLPDDYVHLTGVRMYEGPMDDVPEHERGYLEQFDFRDTRFVYLELQLENQIPGQAWYLELVTKFFNEGRELKGRVVKFVSVREEDVYLTVTVGWGSDTRGTWREGTYTAEIVFLDRLMATVYVDMSEEYLPGSPLVLLPGHDRAFPMADPRPDERGLQEVLAEMDSLIGLDSVKKQVRERAAYMEFLRLRQRRGFLEEGQIQLHAVFKGNPGTGKTTVARMMGAIYFQLGLLSRGHVHTVDRADLVGEYIGQTAPKVKEALDKARGGVLFIDEAYALARANDDVKDFGKEVIEILVKEMSDGQGDLAVIAAGYPAEMDHFTKSNPGLRSRFKMDISFPDYQPTELSRIAAVAAGKLEVVLEPEAWRLVDQIIIREYRERDRSFGNARFVFDLIEQTKIQLGLRVMAAEDPDNLAQEDLSLIRAEDIIRARATEVSGRPTLPVDEELLEEALAELDALHGLARIKKDIRDTVMLVRYYLASDSNQVHRFSMHTLLVGNPGTGKTTVARILAKVYKALGLLERGHVVETDRQGLVAGYVGQTAIKTAERIQEAQGGVLFIDEAYALSQPGSGAAGDFGDEAIQTLLKRMEDHRGNFFVFAAGYPDNMEKFLKANPGLKSRFDRTLVFDDYAVAELMEIAEWQLQEARFQLSIEARLGLEAWIRDLHQQRDRFFGNARVIRQITDQLIKLHQTHLAGLHAEGNTIASQEIGADTIEQARQSSRSGEWDRKGIGFRN
jgi:SpoVK/Ycf46/Vps4 family AAA+-type ATPase